MSTVPNLSDSLEYIKKTLQNSAEFAFLLGSFGTERFHEKSDIDIAVFFKKEPSLDELINFKIQFEEFFGRDVDLVSLNKIDPIFAFQVMSSGRLIFSNQDSDSLVKWKVKQMSIYPDFKMSREIVEKNLLKRKRHV